MALAIVHHEDFQADLAPGHRFPMGKYGAIIRLLRQDGLISDAQLIQPEAIEFDAATHAHAADYVRQVFASNVDPMIVREIGVPVNETVSRRARLSSAATLLAGRTALERGVATSTAGGSHHARRQKGAGFCVFNDVAIASANLLSSGFVRQIMVFDCDVHQGDGTAEIFTGESCVTTISIHNQKNYPVRKVPSDLDIGLADGIEDEAYLNTLADTLERSTNFARPDLVFYNAGVDPHRDDRLGRLALSDDGLARRDRTVLRFFRGRGIPVTAVQGGGYSSDVETVARRHTIIHHVASEFV
jgi:acetoin utilization deacetylase AcuC-like enzyme